MAIVLKHYLAFYQKVSAHYSSACLYQILKPQHLFKLVRVSRIMMTKKTLFAVFCTGLFLNFFSVSALSRSIESEPLSLSPSTQLLLKQLSDSDKDNDLETTDETNDDEIEAEDLDAVDTQLFERTSQLFDQFQDNSDRIWNSQYRLDQMPLMYVRTDGQNDQYAYLINFPEADRLEGAVEVELDDDSDLSNVYKLKNIPNAEEVADIPNFAFNLSIEGVETFMMKYNSPKIDEFTAPVSNDWSLYVGHEGFHDYQEGDDWQNVPDNGQDIANYPVTADHIALIMLEDRALIAALEATDATARDTAIEHFIAIRETRLNQWDDVRLLDHSQEQIEGTAQYVERSLGFLIGAETNFEPDSFVRWFDTELQEQVRDTVAFGRFYITGAALSYFADQLGIPSWTTQIEGGKSPYDLIADYFDVPDDAVASLLETAKSTYGFDELVPKAEAAAEVAASEPTDIFGSEGE